MSHPSSHTLSESDSKELLASFGVPFATEKKVANAEEAVLAADTIGYPVVAKLGGDKIAHKTERGLVRLRLNGADAVRGAADDLLALSRPEDGDVHVLVAPMVS
ncbi:MAG: acetate--CoA ligase family protein, partial [Ilumatobacteraceae bacterium]